MSSEVRKPTFGPKMAASSLGAVTAVLAASNCCLPLLPFLAAAGSAGLSSIFTALRPYLLALSVVLIGFGFYQSRKATECNCRPSLISITLLWISALFVAVSIIFPQAIADLVSRIR